MKRYLPTIFLALLYLISAVPFLIWGTDYRIQNWIWERPTPMAIAWNVKYACSQAMWICVSLMVITYPSRRNKVNAVSMTVFFLWTIFDTLTYFYNYKTFGYFATYAWLAAAWFLIYNWKGKRADKLWQLLDTIRK